MQTWPEFGFHLVCAPFSATTTGTSDGMFMFLVRFRVIVPFSILKVKTICPGIVVTLLLRCVVLLLELLPDETTKDKS